MLPVDTNLNGVNSGYVYTVNDDGSVYKFMALNTVENETLSNSEPHPFFRCGPNFDSTTLSCGNSLAECAASQSYEDGEMCERTPTSVGGSGITIMSTCNNATAYGTTYAVSGGFSTVDIRSDRRIEYYTERIRCQ